MPTEGSEQLAAREDPDAPVPSVTSRVPAWLPNAISALRLILVPVFWLVSWPGFGASPSPGALLPLLILLSIGGSDLLDGFLARRYSLTSPAGVILDAIADRFAQFGIVTFFVFVEPRLPGWLLGLLVTRDIVVGLGSWLVIRAGLADELRHESHGRLASLLLFLLLVIVLVPAPAAWLRVLLALAASVVAVSTVGYVLTGARIGARMMRGGRKSPGPTER